MAEKNFWQDKWLKDQYNERGPGQRNDPAMTKKTESGKARPSADDVLRVMLNTPPKPHTSPASKPTAAKKKKGK